MLADTPEPALPIDPEPVRVIFPGQPADESGLDAMTELIPATGSPGTVFLLPLPPGLTAGDLQLFGFWTYEFRVGHSKLWSTAQGRYGRALRVSGIQHPPPELICSANRTATGIAVRAPYATTVLNGRRVFSAAAGDPRTEIWFMLYAQVTQADGASHRNILLTHAPGTETGQLQTPIKPVGFVEPLPAETPLAGCEFPEDTIHERLALLGLAQTSPLSALAVELLPFDAGEEEENLDAVNPVLETAQTDPLGAQLGTRRILRTSPLTALPTVC